MAISQRWDRKPTLLYHHQYMGESTEIFYHEFRGVWLPDDVSRDVYFIPSVPARKHIEGLDEKFKSVAIFRYGRWEVALGRYRRLGIYILDAADEAADILAFPIDPRMTAADINGATDVFANADNTGWLFGHASEGNHADHEITLMAGIDGVFQPLFRQYHVDLINGVSLNIKQRATTLYALLSQFYGEVIDLARKNARAVVLGHRHKDLHPENGHLHSEIKVAFEATKAKWLTGRGTDATQLATAFTYIGNVLTIPTPETRWDKAARLEAEAKKKAAAETEASTETPSESSGQ